MYRASLLATYIYIYIIYYNAGHPDRTLHFISLPSPGLMAIVFSKDTSKYLRKSRHAKAYLLQIGAGAHGTYFSTLLCFLETSQYNPLGPFH
jgi:hypothetical protein